MENHSLDGQQNIDINDSLDQLAQVLAALGVKEFTMEDDYQYHLVSTDHEIAPKLQDMFKQSITKLHREIVGTKQED